MAELKEKLFSEFAPVSTEEWMAKITADLKGAWVFRACCFKEPEPSAQSPPPFSRSEVGEWGDGSENCYSSGHFKGYCCQNRGMGIGGAMTGNKRKYL